MCGCRSVDFWVDDRVFAYNLKQFSAHLVRTVELFFLRSIRLNVFFGYCVSVFFYEKVNLEIHLFALIAIFKNEIYYFAIYIGIPGLKKYIILNVNNKHI